MYLIGIVLIYFAYLLDPALCAVCANYDPLPGIINCLSNITYGDNKMNVLAGTDTQTIRTHCEEGAFRKAIDCLKVYRKHDECSPKDGGLHLSIPNDMPSLLNTSVHNICTRLPEHAKHSECIVKQRPLIENCLRRNDAIFHHKQEQLKSPSNRAVAYNICRFYKGIEVCTGKYVENRCDRSIGILLGQFIASLRPLNCSTGTPSSATPSYGTHFSVISSWCFTCIYIHVLWDVYIRFSSSLYLT